MTSIPRKPAEARPLSDVLAALAADGVEDGYGAGILGRTWLDRHTPIALADLRGLAACKADPPAYVTPSGRLSVIIGGRAVQLARI